MCQYNNTVRTVITLFLLSATLFADDSSPEALKQEVAALQAQLVALRATQDAKLSILSQTVNACFQAIDKLAMPPPPTKIRASENDKTGEPGVVPSK